MDQPALKGQIFETLTRQDKTLLSRNGDVQYHVNLSMKVTAQDKTPHRGKKHSTLTCREQVTGMTDIGNSLARKTPNGDCSTLKGDDNKHVTS